MYVMTDQLFVLQNETLVFCALESEGDSNFIISQTETFKVSWQGAFQAELCFARNLEKNKIIMHQLISWHIQ